MSLSLCKHVYEGPRRSISSWWHSWAYAAVWGPMIEAARHAETPLRQIITYLKHGITNATSESIKAKIQWVKYRAGGFGN